MPLSDARLEDDHLVVPYDKPLIKDAPRISADEELTAEEEQRLYQHYRLADTSAATEDSTSGPATGTTADPATGTVGTTAGAPTGTAGTTAAVVGRHAGETGVPRGPDRRDVDGDGVFDDVTDTAVGRDTSGLTTDDAMTRSEERLRVGTERREAGRARLRKRIVSDTETRTVPVRREQARVEREPITDANAAAAYAGSDLVEQEHEVVLSEERPVVSKETVPVERVRLDTATVTEQQQISEQVRKENIELDDDSSRPQR